MDLETNEKRAQIRHLTILEPKFYQEVVKSAVDFIFENCDVQNIRLELFHIKDP